MRQFTPAIENISVQSLKPYPRNARRHSKAQIKQIAASIERFGFSNPVLIADDGEIVAGHRRVAAAKLLGIEIVPAVRLSHLSEKERRAYVIADNKLALNAGWDRELLATSVGRGGSATATLRWASAR
jgi:ParB-like chromosome segregation protein Spo0J